MNAVNLIPADSRRRRLALSTSWPTLTLVAALLVVLAGAVLYVTAANNVKSRQAELARVTASANSWRRVAGSYQSFTQMAQQRTQELADIRQLAVGRYPWEHLLSQIGGLMPAKASLTSLQAATAASTTSTGTPPSTSGSPAPATTGGSAALLPAVQLAGCAASQSTVAQTMVQLHRIQGVAAVTLASATDTSASGSGGGSAGSAGSSGCPFPVQFQMSLAFAAPAPAAATAAAGAAPATSGATTTPKATTTPSSPATPSTPAASASTNTPGVTAQ